MTSLLILTVGTGTLGLHSNLALGLINTLKQLSPRLFWLVPSASQDSITLAELVRENAPPGSMFQSWAPDRPFREIEHHDDLFICRAALREVVRAARKCLRDDERLLINPTSGTKQMSAAATLAALDEQVGEVVFTVGERADGVVKTGTERMAPFSTRQFFLERDFSMAAELFDAGAFRAAARLLKPYDEVEAMHAREEALCRYEWRRMRYAEAARHATRFSEDLRKYLDALSRADQCSPEILGDLLASADETLRWHEPEGALARYYRGAELAAKVRLALEFELRPPYLRDSLLALIPPNNSLYSEIHDRAQGGKIQLGNDLAWRLLEVTGDAMAGSYRADTPLQDGLRSRNESVYGHGHRPVDESTARCVADRLRNLFGKHLPSVVDYWSRSASLRAQRGEAWARGAGKRPVDDNDRLNPLQ